MGSLGDDSYKEFVQFKATQASEAHERTTAQVALSHWGVADYDTISAIASRARPQFISPQKTGGCFIATTVFDSPEAPQVMRLREFRDYWLLPSLCGRALVRLYCVMSPPIATCIADRPLLKRTVRRGLEFLVKILPEKRNDVLAHSDKWNR